MGEPWKPPLVYDERTGTPLRHREFRLDSLWTAGVAAVWNVVDNSVEKSSRIRILACHNQLAALLFCGGWLAGKVGGPRHGE